MKITTKLWIGIAILILLSPLGLLLPKYFKAGDAWGEWGVDSIKELMGYVPLGLEKLSSLWKAPLPDYGTSSIAYITSAIIGIFACVAVVFFLGRVLIKKNNSKIEEK